jgi:hypothetical protein
VAGSLGEAIAIISSVNPGGIGTMATAFRGLGSAAVRAGGTLTSSASDVGAQRGEPYAAYEARLAPVGGWLQQIQGPIMETAATLDNAKTVSEQAQWVMAKVLAALAAYGASQTNPATAGAAMAAAEAQALAQLNPEIDKMSAAFAAIQPADPGKAPVHTGGGGTANGTSESSSAGQAGAVPAGTSSVGPQSGPYAGWVQDPTTGNLVDPATGREVDPGGRFVDPVTGQPFGDPAQYASRLEGLQGGAGGAGAAGGQLSAGAGLSPAPAGIGPAGAGGAGAGAGAFAGYYGGMVPPSLAGRNPAAAQLRQKAKENLDLRADTAQRYAAIATGQGQSQGHPYAYMPPMAGMGAVPPGAGGGRRGRSRPGGKGMVSEPASVWGATGRGARGKPREQSGGTELVEDAEVWTGGVPSGSGVLGGR